MLSKFKSLILFFNNSLEWALWCADAMIQITQIKQNKTNSQIGFYYPGYDMHFLFVLFNVFCHGDLITSTLILWEHRFTSDRIY